MGRWDTSGQELGAMPASAEAANAAGCDNRPRPAAARSGGPSRRDGQT